ncbi:actin ACT1 [Pelomyxa schiedti]|nr:actin ACT1 [Pelomyxa schiedti]
MSAVPPVEESSFEAQNDEETNSVVIDCGSWDTKAGLGRAKSPKEYARTVVGRWKNPSEISPLSMTKNHFSGAEALAKQNSLVLTWPVERGMLTNWEYLEELWNDVFYSWLRVAPEEQPLLLTEVPLNPNENREKAAELAFETYSVPMMCWANQAVMSLLSMGHTRGLVIETGGGVTHTVPVVEGAAIPHATVRLPFGGRDLTDYMVKLLDSEHGYHFTTPAEWDTVEKMKTEVTYVAQDFSAEVSKASDSVNAKYTLPDGQVININNERFFTPEALFQPARLGTAFGEMPGIHQCAISSITKCDATQQQILLENVVVSGGNSQFPGITERLKRELTALAPSSIPKPSINVTAPPNGCHSSWCGASILTSLDTFRAMCSTREEYDESGPSVVHHP